MCRSFQGASCALCYCLKGLGKRTAHGSRTVSATSGKQVSDIPGQSISHSLAAGDVQPLQRLELTNAVGTCSAHDGLAYERQALELNDIPDVRSSITPLQ